LEKIKMPNCMVCKTPNAKRNGGEGFTRFDCERCGSFLLSGSPESVVEGLLDEVPLRRSLMSHTLRRMQLPNDKHLRVIEESELASFWREDRLPTPLEQADNLILLIGSLQETPSAWARVTPSVIAATIGIAISPSGGDPQGWSWLNSQLEPRNLYKLHPTSEGGKVGAMLTLEGWEKYEALHKRVAESRTAFMAMKFGDATLDKMLKDCFRPAVKRTGFELRILTDQQAAGLIDDQIRSGLLAARFVIADLTHGNPGAYWEAGYAEGRGISVIYTCEEAVWKANKPHFDTNHLVTIIWDASQPKKAEDALASTIRATLRGEAKQTDD
jgi:nucleoside 2-deoxyribosyltransferase